jgi:hypothetical protein
MNLLGKLGWSAVPLAEAIIIGTVTCLVVII